MLSKLIVSSCGTHHLKDNNPIYEKRFLEILKFHPPGLAPVKDETGAYHIDTSGNPSYEDRFTRTFGFYEGLAAVESQVGAFHIYPDGTPAYDEKFLWCGNFQESFASVRKRNGDYVHINTQGKTLRDNSFAYVGDFKDGIAVVCNKEGLSTHINSDGNYVHNQWYDQLDIYHKGFARAKDDQGWFHIGINGQPLYSTRYQDLEPFYNGVAHATDLKGNIVLLNEQDEIIKIIKEGSTSPIGDLSSQLVGFWQSETIKVAVQSKLLDSLPASTTELSDKAVFPEAKLKRLLDALWELELITPDQSTWRLTDKGYLLTPTHSSHMAAAALMWPQVQKEWDTLEDCLRKEEHHHHPTFKENCTDPQAIACYQRALDGYSESDFFEIGKIIDWSLHKRVVGFGRTAIAAMKVLLKSQPHLKGAVCNKDLPINKFSVPDSLNGRLQAIYTPADQPWPNARYDAVLLPRYLHYFPDHDAENILKQVRALLSPEGKLYIFEMLLSETRPAGALLDLNMLVESGGQLRTLPEWERLVAITGLKIDASDPISPHLQLLEISCCD